LALIDIFQPVRIKKNVAGHVNTGGRAIAGDAQQAAQAAGAARPAVSSASSWLLLLALRNEAH